MRSKIKMENTSNQIKDNLLKVSDVATLLAISPRTVRSWCYRKIIPMIKLHGALRFDRTEIEKFIKGGVRCPSGVL